ncbi:hypothetical protein [Pseudoxanthomonas wuyuanensis]|uniref:FG-GAP repeat-containing protein n=1 Tax=Pseudoxanthomonas wuyuanensis TaxID=1073196 RepID=A0A286CYF1_9GAMM|nr:hypothetical protein [Pseudoxanthomonas wuyuanensis]KAF1722713.1 hypothetical protein CSC75_02495 [Pseudoxanthomonas wuyuanensis]SOD51384.1 hypothetical protein SAMN06296416_101596 [Pseudoxanthomonas wuyuanensis]
MKSLIVIMHAALLPVLAGTAGDAGAATPDAASVESVVQRHVAAANVQARLNQESVEPSQTEIADLDGDGKAEIVLLTVSYGPPSGAIRWPYSPTAATAMRWPRSLPMHWAAWRKWISSVG